MPVTQKNPGQPPLPRLARPGGRLVRVWAIGVIAMVCVLLLMPHLKAPDSAPGQADLVVHLGLMGVLGFSLLWAWHSRPVTTGLVLAGLVICLELGQIWVPGREFSGPDLFTNILGAGLGALLARWMIRHIGM